MPDPSGSDRDILKGYVQNWLNLRRRIEELNKKLRNGGTHPNIPVWADELEQAQRDRARTVKDVRRMVRKNPDLYRVAKNSGFRTALLPKSSKPSRPGNTTTPNAGGAPSGGQGSPNAGRGGGGGGGGNDGPRNRGGNNDRPKNKNNNLKDRDLIPGKKGRDWNVIRYNGKTYAMYGVKTPAGRVRMIWRMDKKDMRANGIKAGDGRRVTREQFRKMDFWGSASEIVRGNGGDKHPFQKTLRDLTEQYRGLSLLRSKEVMSVWLMAKQEGLSAGEIKQRIQRTNFYQKKTEWKRQWELDFTEETRAQMIDQRNQDIRNHLDEAYGRKGWRGFVDSKKLDSWAKKVASGVWGEPGEALNDLFSRLTKQAEKVEGTAAWIAKQQEIIDERNFMNRPEEAYAQLREDAISWLGYGGRLDDNTLKSWANDIAFSRKSQADWEKHMRTVKRGLHPYLDPDEKFMDAGAPYKGALEQLLGGPVSWQDSLLRNFAAKDDEGNPVDTRTRMSLDDFGRMVREDDRYRGSKDAKDRVSTITSYLLNTFEGVTP